MLTAVNVKYTSHFVHMLFVRVTYIAVGWLYRAVRSRVGHLILVHFVTLFCFAPIFFSGYPLCVNTDKIKLSVFLSKLKEVGSITHPSMPRTCHHFTPPTTSLALSSPPRHLMRYFAASSQLDNGMTSLTTCVQGGDNVGVFEKPFNRAGMRTE